MSNDNFLDSILAPLKDMVLTGPLAHEPFSISGRPYNADATYCANGEWCVSTINGSARPGVWVMNARRFEGDTMIVHPLHGVEFPSHEAARQAQYEADLIVEFIPRDQREVVSA